MSITAIYGVLSSAGDSSARLAQMIPAIPAPESALFRIITRGNASIAFLARSETVLDTCYYEENGIATFLIGKLFHSGHTARHLPMYIHTLYTTQRLRDISHCIGEFNVIIMDVRNNRLVLISDCLGIRPLFFYKDSHTVTFGSNVWPMLSSGLIPRKINYDALAAWICLDYSLNNSSLFADVNKVPAGSILIFSGGRLLVNEYLTLSLNDQILPQHVAADLIHHTVLRSCKLMVQDEQSLACFLSGGFDSRYLLAMLTTMGFQPDVYTVPFDSAEEAVATEVARALNVRLYSFGSSQSIYDMMQPFFHFSNFGFPIGKFCTIIPIRQLRPARTLIDGLLGDDLIRSYDDERDVHPCEKDHESLTESLFCFHLENNPALLFSPGVASRIIKRVTSQIAAFVADREVHREKIGLLWVLLNRKGNYLSNNHLQYLEYADTIHPFYHKELIQFRFTYDDSIFTKALYKRILSTFYPDIGHIPHSSELVKSRNSLVMFSQYFWTSTPRVLLALFTQFPANVVRRHWLAPRLVSYLFGVRRCDYVIRPLLQILMLQERLREADIDICWNDL